MCIDNTSNDIATLQFSAAARVGSPNTRFTELDVYRNTLAVYFGDSDNQPFYYQRPDSEAPHVVTVPIPHGYKGPLAIELINGRGQVDWRETDPARDKYDYWIIDDVELRIPSGTSEVGSGVRLSPNPTHDGFTIAVQQLTGSGMSTSVYVYDALGRLRHQDYLYASSSGLYVPTDTWLPGVYTVSMETVEGRRYVERVIVQ